MAPGRCEPLQGGKSPPICPGEGSYPLPSVRLFYSAGSPTSGCLERIRKKDRLEDKERSSQLGHFGISFSFGYCQDGRGDAIQGSTALSWSNHKFTSTSGPAARLARCGGLVCLWEIRLLPCGMVRGLRVLDGEYELRHVNLRVRPDCGADGPGCGVAERMLSGGGAGTGGVPLAGREWKEAGILRTLDEGCDTLLFYSVTVID